MVKSGKATDIAKKDALNYLSLTQDEIYQLNTLGKSTSQVGLSLKINFQFIKSTGKKGSKERTL